MKLETLYKRAKTGKIVSYNIEVVKNGAVDSIVKTTGQIDGKKTQHIEHVLVGKNIGKSNETTPYQQACLQAKSDWTKKKDEGYKSRQELGIDISGDLMHYRYNYTNYASLTEVLNIALPKENTDSSGNTKPMLAQEYEKKKHKVVWPWLAQPKLDGVRCLCIIPQDLGKITFLSRSGKEYKTLDHIKDDLKTYFWGRTVPVILDGEIYSDGLTFQEITSAVKAVGPDNINLQYRVYDIVNDKKQIDRWRDIHHLVQAIGSDHIQSVGTVYVADETELLVMHDAWVAEGYEGAMLRNPEALYEPGARSNNLLKVKKFDDGEFPLIRFEKGLRDEDLIAVCQTKDGKEFKAKMMGTKEEKAKINIEDNIKGFWSLTVKYFGLTDDGIPRFPIGKSIRDYE